MSIDATQIPASDFLRLIDSESSMAGMGCIVVVDRDVIHLRPAGASRSMVVIELRKPVAQGGGRNSVSAPSSDWISLGLDCGGAVIAWLGVSGGAALAPFTGGVSAVGSAMLYAGAVATTTQCAVTSFKLGNTLAGNQQFNDRLDNNLAFRWSMYGVDSISLLSAGGAIKELTLTNRALKEADFTWAEAAGALNRHDRLLLTDALKLQGAKRVAEISINSLVKQRVVDGIGAAMAIASSAKNKGGALHDGALGLRDVVIWAVSDD